MPAFQAYLMSKNPEFFGHNLILDFQCDTAVRAIQSRLFLGIRHHKTWEEASIIEKMLAPFQ